jgi:hypothetical protein
MITHSDARSPILSMTRPSSTAPIAMLEDEIFNRALDVNSGSVMN